MLLDKINNFCDKNIAYFVKFDGERESGTETLFVSGKDPIKIYQNALDFMNGEMKTYMKNYKEIPLFITYDFIDEIFPDIHIMKSKWPEIAFILPEQTFREKIAREEKPPYFKNFDITDKELSVSIEDAINRIKNGELLQIVISKRFDLSEFDVMNAIKNFIFNDKSLYVYYYKFGDLQIIGSSPENIFTVIDKKIIIDPIAGTRRRGNTEEEDIKLEMELKNDEKELLEHRMLVDLARNDLGKICYPGSVNVVKSMEIQKFASVQHLVSSVEGKLINNNPGDILKAIFPAGTVSGAPKKRAIYLINQYEKIPRGPYAGGVGIIGAKYMDLALAIRTLFKDNYESYTQAGAGIVKDSIAVNEVNEMNSKVLTVIGGLYEKNIDD